MADPTAAAPAATTKAPRPAATIKKKPGQGLWKEAGGGPGPADWRKRSGKNKVYGLARRKGEKNPRNYRLHVDDSMRGHPRYKEVAELPPLSKPREKKEKGPGVFAKLKKGKGGGGGDAKKNCAVM